MFSAKLRLKQLNGWQRTWVLLSAVWLLGVGYWAIGKDPGDADFFYEIGRAYCLAHTCSGKDMTRAISEVYPELVSNFGTGPRTCQGLHEAIVKMGRAKEVEQRYENYLQERRTHFFARVIAYLAIPIAVSYLLGLSIAWVIRGFRRKSSQ
ncbi:MAG TPA: hypothetical protein VK643_01295 [Burkholderiales bacterium]|jgi:hypothetical protein|nr:hypothetical protein [Burkholderiales bacterium]